MDNNISEDKGYDEMSSQTEAEMMQDLIDLGIYDEDEEAVFTSEMSQVERIRLFYNLKKK